MNKKDNTEYTCTNRQGKRRGLDNMFYNIHDIEYTFADEYYQELQDSYHLDMLKDIDEDNE